GGALLVVLTVTPGEGEDVVAPTELHDAGGGAGVSGATGPDGAVDISDAVCARRGSSASKAPTMEAIETVKCRFFMDAARGKSIASG
ncbi:MAG TPA: hypothetical protein VHY09_05495, partial [Candidatus Methylacidiphilales bacterium]|nr:hypothetical protein [Candidatus Methylacidiphilales bacterium]